MLRRRNLSLSNSPSSFETLEARTMLAAATIAFDRPSSSGLESILKPAIKISLSKPLTTAATVKYRVTGGTATRAVDYRLAAQGTLTFRPGKTSITLPLTIVNDLLDEPDQTLIVRLELPTGARLGTPKIFTYKIKDNDAPPTVSFGVASSSTFESVTTTPVTIVLSAPSERVITVAVGAPGGTATLLDDYDLPDGVATIAPGQTSTQFTVHVIADNLPETDETVGLQLISPTNASLGPIVTHALTIHDGLAPAGRLIYNIEGNQSFLLPFIEQANVVALGAPLRALSGGDENGIGASLSPDGLWIVAPTTGFDPATVGYPGIGLYKSDLTSGELIRDASGNVVHAEQMTVASGGNLVVYVLQGNHPEDIWAIRRTQSGWSEPLNLTATSPFFYHRFPAISDDGTKVIFDAGDTYDQVGTHAYDWTNLAQANTDGSGLRIILSRHLTFPGHTVADTNSLHHPDYAPDGSIVFEADGIDGVETIWRLAAGDSLPTRVGNFENDNSPTVLPDGRIVSLWLGRPGNNTGAHEVKLMTADGADYTLFLQNTDVWDVGISAGA